MKVTVIAAAAVAALAFAPAANAAVIINISQVGSAVQAVTSGSLNTTGLTTPSPFAYTLVASIGASQGYIATGVANSLLTGYAGIVGAAAFGTGSLTPSTSSSGTGFGLNSGQLAYVPRGYVSGSAIASQDTFANSTLASLGLVSGQYSFIAPNDSITVNVGQSLAAAVPEATTWAMMILGMGAIGFATRRRQKVSTTVQFA